MISREVAFFIIKNPKFRKCSFCSFVSVKEVGIGGLLQGERIRGKEEEAEEE